MLMKLKDGGIENIYYSQLDNDDINYENEIEYANEFDIKLTKFHIFTKTNLLHYCNFNVADIMYIILKNINKISLMTEKEFINFLKDEIFSKDYKALCKIVSI